MRRDGYARDDGVELDQAYPQRRLRELARRAQRAVILRAAMRETLESKL
jgi:hypothetical protein